MLGFSSCSLTSAGPPQYDADASAFYARVGDRSDTKIVETLNCGVVNLDCNEDGAVVGIEVFVDRSSTRLMSRLSLPIPPDGIFCLMVDEELKPLRSQVYDADQQIMRLGVPSGSEDVRFISKYVLAGIDESKNLVFWIKSLELA